MDSMSLMSPATTWLRVERRRPMEYGTLEIARAGATAQSCPFLYHFHTESIPYIALADCSCMSDAVRPDSGPAKASASSHSSIRAVSRRADSVSVRRSRACVARSRAQRRPSVALRPPVIAAGRWSQRAHTGPKGRRPAHSFTKDVDQPTVVLHHGPFSGLASRPHARDIGPGP